jgi:hypothetical protein
LWKIVREISALENHHALSNRRTGLCDLEANHRGDGRMTAENQLDLLFETTIISVRTAMTSAVSKYAGLREGSGTLKPRHNTLHPDAGSAGGSDRPILYDGVSRLARGDVHLSQFRWRSMNGEWREA